MSERATRKEAEPDVALLAEAARGGDREAFGQLVVRFQDMAVGTAFVWLHDADRARDAAQEAFTEAYLRLDQLREPAAFPGWLRRIVRKQCDRVTRRRSRTTASLDQIAEPIGDATPADVRLESDESLVRVRRAIERLPEPERIAVALHYLAGEPQDRVAAFLEIAPGTLRKRLHAARRRLEKGSLTTMRTTTNALRPSNDTRFSDEIMLFLAVRAGDSDGVRALLDLRPELVDAEENYDRDDAIANQLPIPTSATPLIRAAECGDVEMVDLLLDRGADPNRDCGCPGQESALWAALVSRRTPVVARLIERGADVDAAAFFGKTPLHVAAIRGYDDLVALLLDAGADPTRRCAAGHTALDWARKKNRADAIACLEFASPTSSEPVHRVHAFQPQSAGDGLVATGIKALDLFAPFLPGDRLRLHGGAGLGQVVMLSELVHNLSRSDDVRFIWALFADGAWEERTIDAGLAETGIDGLVHTVMCRPGCNERDRREVAERAVVAAENVLGSGVDHVVVTFFEQTGFGAEVEALLPRFGARDGCAISAIAIEPLVAEARISLPPLPSAWDGRIALDPGLARLHHFPAVHPLLTTSRRLSPDIAGPLHCEIAREAAALLARLREVDPTLSQRPEQEFAAADRDAVRRARQLQGYLTQPFQTVEPFIARPGAWIPRDTTLDGVARILEGELSRLDPRHFVMRGGLDEVLAAAEGSQP